MKKLSSTFLKVGMIIGFILAGIFLLAALICLMTGLSDVTRAMLIEAYNNGEINTDLPDAEAFATFVQIYLITFAVVFIYLGAMSLVDAIVASLTLRQPSKGKYIACIVLGAMCIEFLILGGIFGLIALKRENQHPEAVG